MKIDFVHNILQYIATSSLVDLTCFIYPCKRVHILHAHAPTILPPFCFEMRTPLLLPLPSFSLPLSANSPSCRLATPPPVLRRHRHHRASVPETLHPPAPRRGQATSHSRWIRLAAVGFYSSSVQQGRAAGRTRDERGREERKKDRERGILWTNLKAKMDDCDNGCMCILAFSILVSIFLALVVLVEV